MIKITSYTINEAGLTVRVGEKRIEIIDHASEKQIVIHPTHIHDFLTIMEEIIATWDESDL